MFLNKKIHKILATHTPKLELTTVGITGGEVGTLLIELCHLRFQSRVQFLNVCWESIPPSLLPYNTMVTRDKESGRFKNFGCESQGWKEEQNLNFLFFF